MTSVDPVDPTLTDRMWSRIARALVERRDSLARIGKASPFWLGTPADAAGPRA
jgi:hypothetical protein